MDESSSSSFVSSTNSVDNSHEDSNRKHGLSIEKLLEQPTSESRPAKPLTADGGGRNGTQAPKNCEEYLKKRARNNLAVKKSRDRSKKRIVETQERVEQLTKENDDLNTKVTLLSKELSVLRALFTNGGFTVPCNLQIVAQNPVTTPQETRYEAPKTFTPSMPVNAPSPNVTSTSNHTNHTSVIRSASSTSPSSCHGVILVTEPGKMNLDIQTGIQFKEERE
eukprot:Seg2619.5 transcript_id=Seg2619.5/GoldUCD/mRNA.D3Y31 product="CCAAT/enhancer-binding protein gamma" protein_id=Seg2619.5/GoldUCD/D3Y31